MAVMDHVKGWNEKGWERMIPHQASKKLRTVGGLLVDYNNAMICNGQKNMDEFLDKKRHSVVEAVNLACSRDLPDHGWVCEFTVLMRDK